MKEGDKEEKAAASEGKEKAAKKEKGKAQKEKAAAAWGGVTQRMGEVGEQRRAGGVKKNGG